VRSLLRWFGRNRRRLVLGTAGVGSLLFAGAFLYGASCGFRGCPTEAEIRAYRPVRGSIPLARIPESVRDAFIAVEDRRFAEHDGIDWRSFGRAFVRNAKALEVREGASTITMQLARGAFIPGDECGGRSLGRKLVELRLAGLLESSLSKDRILELYLNQIYLGDGKYGVEAASRHYFGKTVSRLTVAEAAMLAALPRAPSLYDPRSYPDRARARRDLVLGLMRQQGYLTVAEATAAARSPLRVAAQRGRSAAPPAPIRVSLTGASRPSPGRASDPTGRRGSAVPAGPHSSC
jgi:membrane peptidoglycan carboxypeptidase